MAQNVLSTTGGMFPPAYMEFSPIVSRHDEAILYFFLHVGVGWVLRKVFSPKNTPKSCIPSFLCGTI